MKDYFCGWYFRCQSEDHTVALIPAIHMTGGVGSGSIQFISDEGNWNVTLPGKGLRMQKDKPRAMLGSNIFREDGIWLDLHTDGLSAEGKLRFDGLSPLRYDIMGPFRYMPFMECRHSVVSMRHTVNGSLRINGRSYDFQNGTGYIEGDRGRSFPKRYVWTQCCFEGGSLMLSVAEIPFGPMSFTGIIGVIRLHGKEYRLATYLGARVLSISSGAVTAQQGELMLTATLLEKSGHLLQAPAKGAMTRLIRENVACHARYQLHHRGHTVWSLETTKAAFEYEYLNSGAG